MWAVRDPMATPRGRGAPPTNSYSVGCSSVPRPDCGERATRHCQKPDLGSVRGRFDKLRLAGTPPHPDLLHSPSQTGVNALMASGAKERACARGYTGAIRRAAATVRVFWRFWARSRTV